MQRQWLLLTSVAALLVLLPGCVSQTVKKIDAEPAIHAEREIPPAELINVNISVFKPNVPKDPASLEKQNIYPAVRNAEARYMPYTLRKTLQDTGQWGAVRVVPEPIASSELLVTGKILYSDGATLKLHIKAEDATGRVWLDKEYDQQAASLSYTESSAQGTDPFQGLYNRVANDLLDVRRKLDTNDVVAIRRVSELRFADDLAPDSFDSYLTKKDGRYSVQGLPAKSDPMVQRVNRIRDRDYALIDALDQHYGLFYQQIDPAYNEWRASSYRESVKLRELRKQALGRKVLGAAVVIAGIVGLIEGGHSNTASVASQAGIIGGAVLFSSGLQKGRESKLHAEALKELGKSLASDVKPRVVQLEGQTVTLTGSAQAQYDEWRQILKKLYAQETGFAPAVDVKSDKQDPDL